jgi:DNA-binding CsgD family transcriptional regulator
LEDDGAARKHGFSPEQPPQIVPLATIWRRLVAGSWTAEDAYCGKQRCYLVVTVHEPTRAPAKRQGDLATLKRILGGELQKRVAIERDCSPSTVTHSTRTGLRRFGFHCTARRTPIVVTLAACADEYDSPAVALLYPHADGSSARFLISTERPDRTLPECLSPREQEVVRGVVEGASNEQIARASEPPKAVRTVANQLANIFKKLDVGTRVQLVWELSRASVAPATERTKR